MLHDLDLLSCLWADYHTVQLIIRDFPEEQKELKHVLIGVGVQLPQYVWERSYKQ